MSNYPPIAQKLVDDNGIVTDAWVKYFLKTMGGLGGPAPASASYVTTGAEPALPGSRALTDSASVKVDLSVVAQVDLQRAALTGDVTAALNSNALTIANDAVTYAKMQNISAASRLLGRGSAAGSGDPQEMTVGAGLTITGTVLDVAASVGLIKKASASLTDTNIKNLGVPTAVTVVTALGANIIIVPLFYMMKFYTSAGAYSGLTNGAFLQFEYSNAELASYYIPNDSGQTPAITLLSDVLGSTTNRILKLESPWSAETSSLATAWGNIAIQNTMDTQNKNIRLVGSGFAAALGGGNGANHLDIDTYYVEVTI